MKDRLIIIDTRVPEGATDEELTEYILDALQAWGGCHHPDDPFSLSIKMIAIAKPGKEPAKKTYEESP